MGDFKQYHFWHYWPNEAVYTVSKHPSLEYGETFYLDGGQSLQVHEQMARNMRLTYLSNEYFDSFTISSIINGFERNYLKKMIDPLIEDAVHRACYQLLQEYDTQYDEDENELQEVRMERNIILQRMEDENEDVDMLRDELWELDMSDQVLRYRMSEKVYLMECNYLQILFDV